VRRAAVKRCGFAGSRGVDERSAIHVERVELHISPGTGDLIGVASSWHLRRRNISDRLRKRLLLDVGG
jgi:hypothetical protein